MPWSADFTPRTIVATGNINDRYDVRNSLSYSETINNDTLKTRTKLYDLYAMASFLHLSADRIHFP